jgi:hypothetical protein
MLPFDIQRLPLNELIDRFNEPCRQSDCQFTSKRKDDDWCRHHIGLREELERRQRIFESIPASARATQPRRSS